MILSCNHINKSFGTNTILSDVSFHVNENEKAAIIGINGAGKSTLLKIIIGELRPDMGDVILSKGSTLGYLSQQQDLTTDHTIYEEVMDAKKDIVALDKQIRQLELDMKSATAGELEQMLKTYTRCTHEFEIKNGYACESEVTGVLKGLSFTQEEFGQKINTLSGGQKTRVALGKLLLSTPDIILLDEPTNHLDMTSIAWLENYLLNYKGAVLIVAHDRYFLDKVVSKVVEIEFAKAQTFLGNYSTYAQKKELQRESLLKQFYNQQSEIKHQEEVIAKLKSFNREKSIKRAESREKMLNKIEVLDKPITETAEMKVHFEPRILSGNDVLTIKDLSKSFDGNPLFTNISFDIKRGERIAIIGNNGSGKTTILKILNKFLEADGGEIKLGSKVKIGYYDQEHQVLSSKKTLFEELQDTYPFMDNTAIRNSLAAFLFTGDDVFKRIEDLSGGERGRVSLAKLMLSEANLLILDEPTNHLDIVSKEILENALNHYTGTILYVSHDRYFINKTATGILHLTERQLLKYIGNYDYYIEKKDEIERAYLDPLRDDLTMHPTAHPKKDDSTCIKANWQQQKEEQARIRKLNNDLKKVETSIHDLELENEQIDVLLTKEEIYTDVSKLMELNKKKKTIEESLENYYEQWEILSEELE